MARKLIVEIVGDAGQLERQFARAQRSTRGFSRNIEQAGRGAVAGTLAFKGLGRSVAFASGAFLGGAGFIAVMKTSLDAASNLQEQMAKTNVVFGKSADEVEEWSKTTAKGMGLARDAALSTASSFGALLAPLGIIGKEAADQSRQLTQLGADLASFYNTSVQDALDAIRSGLVGESEPLRRYGVLLSEARVQQEALRQTGKKHAEQLTAQEKVLARQALIFRDTSKAQGDFARTSGGLANQQRILSANLRDTQILIGQALLPKVLEIVTAMNDWLGATENQERVQRDFAKTVEITAAAVTGLAKAIREVSDAIQFVRNLPGSGYSGLDLARDIRKNLPFGLGGIPGLRVDEPELHHILPDFSDPNALRGMASDAARTAADAAHVVVASAKEAVDKELRKGPSQSLRNLWFDADISRQLDRVQDLGLRKQLERLKQIAAEVRDRLAITKDTTRRLNLEDQLLSIYRQQKSVQEQITDSIKAANAALKDRADAIKAAVLDRLDRRRTDVLNRRALDDAREQLRIAREIGGPQGIEAARRAVQDVRFDIQRARVERAPAALGGGRFALGNVITVNVNGADNPEEIARKVVTLIQRKGRHQTSQTRGTFADQRIQ